MGNWKKMTEEQKARARERARIYRTTPRAKAMQRERHRRWNAANREKLKAQKAAWYAANRERMLERNRLWREANRERKREIDRAWRKAHPDYYKNIYASIKADDARMADLYAIVKQWREDNKERLSVYNRKHAKRCALQRRMLFASSVDAYQRELARRRDYSRRKAEEEGREYRPRLSMRKPSWAVYGIDSHLASSSPYLRNNIDAARLREIDGYARKLAISRKEGNR